MKRDISRDLDAVNLQHLWKLTGRDTKMVAKMLTLMIRRSVEQLMEVRTTISNITAAKSTTINI
jgi:hypothetical protein